MVRVILESDHFFVDSWTNGELGTVGVCGQSARPCFLAMMSYLVAYSLTPSVDEFSAGVFEHDGDAYTSLRRGDASEGYRIRPGITNVSSEDRKGSPFISSAKTEM